MLTWIQPWQGRQLPNTLLAVPFRIFCPTQWGWHLLAKASTQGDSTVIPNQFVTEHWRPCFVPTAVTVLSNCSLRRPISTTNSCRCLGGCLLHTGRVDKLLAEPLPGVSASVGAVTSTLMDTTLLSLVSLLALRVRSRYYVFRRHSCCQLLANYTCKQDYIAVLIYALFLYLHYSVLYLRNYENRLQATFKLGPVEGCWMGVLMSSFSTGAGKSARGCWAPPRPCLAPALSWITLPCS